MNTEKTNESIAAQNRYFLSLLNNVPYVPSCLTCLRALRALIFTRLSYTPCGSYLRANSKKGARGA